MRIVVLICLLIKLVWLWSFKFSPNLHAFKTNQKNQNKGQEISEAFLIGFKLRISAPASKMGPIKKNIIIRGYFIKVPFWDIKISFFLKKHTKKQKKYLDNNTSYRWNSMRVLRFHVCLFVLGFHTLRCKSPDNGDCICGNPQGCEPSLPRMEARFSGPGQVISWRL